MRTPEELLCSRKWRIAHSWWMLFGFFPFGVLAWIGYLIIGIRARNWKWLLIAGALLGWVIFWFAWAGSYGTVEKYAPHPDPVANAWWGWLGIGVWLGNAFALQWFINRRWLVWRAHFRKKVWYQDATASRTAPPSTIPAANAPRVIDTALAGSAAAPAFHSDPARVSTQRSDAAQAPAQGSSAHHAATETVFDLNTATRDELATLPGIDTAWANHIVTTRERLGGFKDTSELVTAASMQPHFFALVRGRVRVEPTTPGTSAPEPPAGGRRLEF